jgi:hypothetical protein
MNKNLSILTILLLFTTFFAVKLSAQSCPSPINVQMEILPGPPPIAHVSWDAPPGGPFLGYQITYSINGGPLTTIILPNAPTEYFVSLSKNWESINATLYTICKDGTLSNGLDIRTDNLIIEDLVLLREAGAAEQKMCQNPCPTATYFRYPSDTDPVLVNWVRLYNSDIFCKCMNANNGQYGNPAVLSSCRLSARELIDKSRYYLALCTDIGMIKGEERQSFSDDPDRKLTIAPNPFETQIVVQGTTAFFLDIYTITGQYVKQITIDEVPDSSDNEVHTIDLNDLASGLYIGRFTLPNAAVKVVKLVKQ